MIPRPPRPALFPYTTLFRSQLEEAKRRLQDHEKKLQDFRQRNNGQLPDQVQSNLTMLQTVQLQLQNIRSEEHTSELQSRRELVCRLLLEKKKSPPRTHLPET